MSVSYDVFTGAFLSKITEYELSVMSPEFRQDMVDGFLKRAASDFSRICKYDLSGTINDVLRTFDVDIDESELDEIVDILSEGMVVQWLKPYVFRQELLENTMNTRDFVTYSPAELLMRVGNAYTKAQKDYKQMKFEYSYNTGDLTELHL